MPPHNPLHAHNKRTKLRKKKHFGIGINNYEAFANEMDRLEVQCLLEDSRGSYGLINLNKKR